MHWLKPIPFLIKLGYTTNDERFHWSSPSHLNGSSGGVTVASKQPWTLVLSEYLDLPFLLRTLGKPVVSARSYREALACLQVCSPTELIVDAGTYGADEVVSYARRYCTETRLEFDDAVIDRLLAS